MDKTQEFILKAKAIHGDKYNYDLVEHKNNFIKVKISCPIHGEFLQIPYNHIILGYGCRKCGSERGSKQKTLKTEDFVKRAEDIYGDAFDYSKSIYKGLFENIEIVCKQHGSFFRTPCNFLRQKNGCPQCNELSANIKKFNKIKQELQNKDKDKYDYSLFTFQDYQNKRIPTICKKHGLFIRDFESHLYGDRGCQKCSYGHLTTEEFIQQSKDLHGNFYHYSNISCFDLFF